MSLKRLGILPKLPESGAPSAGLLVKVLPVRPAASSQAPNRLATLQLRDNRDDFPAAGCKDGVQIKANERQIFQRRLPG